MSAPVWEDLAVFLDEDEFAAEAVISYADDRAPERAVSVIFDEAYLDVELGEYQAENFAPRVQGRSAELGSIARGDVMVIDGRTFDVLSGAQRDGTGWSVVSLTERSDAGF